MDELFAGVLLVSTFCCAMLRLLTEVTVVCLLTLISVKATVALPLQPCQSLEIVQWPKEKCKNNELDAPQPCSSTVAPFSSNFVRKLFYLHVI